MGRGGGGPYGGEKGILIVLLGGGLPGKGKRFFFKSQGKKLLWKKKGGGEKNPSTSEIGLLRLAGVFFFFPCFCSEQFKNVKNFGGLFFKKASLNKQGCRGRHCALKKANNFFFQKGWLIFWGGKTIYL